MTAGSEEYPRRLLDLTDPPAVLFVRGRALTEMDPAVAVVGARNCSVLGREVATDLGRQLAGAGVAVVSGGARGIDIAAHRGALAWRDGGRTVAVLGCGIDAPYPRSHEAELLRIAEVGCLISEYPPEVRPEPRNFPARNRIIAALADAVVVVEGARGSGSMITTEHALDLGRSIFAVPGSVTSPLSSVPLGLIRDGAVMIRGATDLLEDLGLAPASDPADEDVGGDASLNLPAGLSVEEVAVAETLAGPTLAEKVARSTGSSLQEALSLLLALELKGVVRNTGGRYELRLRPRDQA